MKRYMAKRISVLCFGLMLMVSTAFADMSAGYVAYGVPGVYGQVTQQVNCAHCQSRWEFGNGSYGQFKVVVALNGSDFWMWNTLDPAWRPVGRIIPGSIFAVGMKKEGSSVVVEFDAWSLKTQKKVRAVRKVGFGPFWQDNVGRGKIYSYTTRNDPTQARPTHFYVTTLPIYAKQFSGKWVAVGNPTPNVFTVQSK